MPDAAPPRSRLSRRHAAGGSLCPGCQDPAYPVPCVCGGDIHHEWGSTSHSGTWSIWECDRCGHEYDRWPAAPGSIPAE